MVYRGHVRNGVVVFDGPMPLPEGARVTIQPEPVAPSDVGPSLAESLGDFIGKAKGLPSDFARNHDHYIHGTRKK
ncbi:MAG TPA: hypothetical protein VM008_16455 [Phycisphaerae bacterium]|nr:hypothetical protein [Phycisphaerae bacterium]